MKGISYMEHLIRQIAESTRVIELATAQINELKARIHDLEVENERLRARLAKNLDHIRRIEEGDL